MAALGAPAGENGRAADLGLNEWLADELRQSYRVDPASVSADWRAIFDAELAITPATPQRVAVVDPLPAPAQNGVSLPVSTAPSAPPRLPPANGASGAAGAPSDGVAEALRGSAGRLVENMVASLQIPTATSFHPVPAKLLEVNRELINERLQKTTGQKVSFTHLIGYAVVQALRDVPALNASFVPPSEPGDPPGVRHHEHVGLGLAIDLERKDHSGRTLVVPVLVDADNYDFAGFVAAYEDIVQSARSGKLSPDDFVGATVTITNPGTLGTTQSVPRLMVGQGAIIGVGAIGYPAEFGATDPETLATLGVGKVVTLTAHYDHRIIQGAESGAFLTRVHELLVGMHGFYDDVFTSLAMPSRPIPWQVDRNPLAPDERARNDLRKQVQVQALINMYRVRGHLIAQLDPLRTTAPELRPDLDPASYGLSVWDLDRRFVTGGLAGSEQWTLREILAVLRAAYCQTIGVEYMHIQSPDEKRWIQSRVEGVDPELPLEDRLRILDQLDAAETFERFLHARYIGQKRFGLEGGESAIPLLDALLEAAARAGANETVLGMSHRGRLNVLANVVGMAPETIFDEFEGNLDPQTVQGSGDVKYHKGAFGTWTGPSGATMPITVASNPSHLEAVDPVVEGIARAKQDAATGRQPFSVLPLLLHGDAAFAGQGVVAETLNLSLLSGYRTGGTIHVIINNQVGFTTSPASSRSSVYPSDVAKTVQSPIFHVNGDDPEACVRAARLALAYREAFHKDVVIDLFCYRLHGHNETDDPSYTQPLLYKAIEAHPSVRTLYAEALVRVGVLSSEEAAAGLAAHAADLQAALEEARSTKRPPITELKVRPLSIDDGLGGATAVDRTTIERVSEALFAVPSGFTVHPKLAAQLRQRRELYESGEVDWALGESLAIGTLLLEGTDVRLTGQDTRRGTFSQRHSVLVDYESGEEYTPLSHIVDDADGSGIGRFFVRDSSLSEFASVGFEYGYSVEARDALVCWEAQFGDFANGAQVILDNFLVGAEEKWNQHSGLVLLLPHGHEGQGPEHSSGRIERFLNLGAGGTITVVQPTTAAQYFHLLRAQAHREVRRPLVAFTPKSLLRARTTRSSIGALESGRFLEVLDDPAADGIDRAAVERLVFATGKVAYQAIERRDLIRSAGRDPRIAVVRVEQLQPWPASAIASILERYPNRSEVCWLQEEPENMGAWSFVHERLHGAIPGWVVLHHVARAPSGSPATGSHAVHELEQEELITRAIGAKPKGTAG